MSWASADHPPTVEVEFGGRQVAHTVVPPRDVRVDGVTWRPSITTLVTKDHLEGGVPFVLPLFRYGREGRFNDGPPVLLLHGATAWSESFVMPSRNNLVQSLLALGHDVWLLDWRGGRHVSSWYVDRRYRERITFDLAARFDVWGAVEHIALARDGAPVRIGGHCMGSNITAIAVGMGKPAWVTDRVRVVIDTIQLSTIGLFYVQPWDGLLRASDHLLERIAAADPTCPGIHPNGDPAAWPHGLDCWPAELDRAFQLWPDKLLPGRPAPRGVVRPQAQNDGVPDAFTRLAFMFGRVVNWATLDEEMKTQAAFVRQFGMMPLQLYIHAGQNVRRGFSAPFGAPERRDLYAREGDGPSDGAPLGSQFMDREAFAGLRRVTLITGRENDLWHRDAMDRMQDWLAPVMGEACIKHVVPGFSHQDLLWGAGEAGDRTRALYVEALHA